MIDPNELPDELVADGLAISRNLEVLAEVLDDIDGENLSSVAFMMVAASLRAGADVFDKMADALERAEGK